MTECASAPLADIRQREEQPSKPRNHRKNTTEELRKKRLKRNQNRKQALKALSKKARRKLMAEKICAKRLEEDRRVFQQELLDLEHRKDEERSKALYFWKMWKQERTLQRVQRLLTFNMRGQGLGNSLVGSFLFALITCAQHTHLTKLSGNDLEVTFYIVSQWALL